MSGDVELNPGPVNGRNRQCRALYSNIRELYGNLHDLIVASKGLDILFCSETLVSNIRHVAELSIPGSKGQYYLNVMKSMEPREWQYILGVVVLPLIRPSLMWVP